MEKKLLTIGQAVVIDGKVWKVDAITNQGGERYYFLSDKEGTIFLCPATIAEAVKPEPKKSDVAYEKVIAALDKIDKLSDKPEALKEDTPDTSPTGVKCKNITTGKTVTAYHIESDGAAHNKAKTLCIGCIGIDLILLKEIIKH